ncbi:MAG: three-Cys-motif partner protein TcmP [Spirochaetia bacterium]|nr:three-Cys-motif partner protein TcmP [Spirochaetia bacterium]
MEKVNGFFEEQKEQSMVKSKIVAKYFDAWAQVIIGTQKRYTQYTQKLAYIDLFAGPGRYKDGTMSTPVEILEKAIQNPDLRERLITIFNDKDERSTKDLEEAVMSIPGISSLRYSPQIMNDEVGEEIVKMFESMSLIPTLFFVDPWGYKGLSLRLVNSVLKDWGSDSIFFFNYNRINMGINNDAVKNHMEALFGRDRYQYLRERIQDKRPHQREQIIVEELCQALKESGIEFVLPFRFKDDRGGRTSHHLIFASKHFKGYEIMKDIMARESSNKTQEVPSFEYNPADALPKQSLLFQLSRPLDELRDELLTSF